MASATIQVRVYDYYTAQSALRGKDRRKIGNNTYLIRLSETEIVVQYHKTYIVKFYPGVSKYTSGGWQTYTTKDRLNQLLPPGWGIYQKNWEWFLRNFYTQEVKDWQGEMMFVDSDIFVS